MAKKKKMSGPKFNLSAPSVVSTESQAKREEQYKIEDDARTVRNYGKLMSDRQAHSKAIKSIRSENAMIAQLESRGKSGKSMQPRIVARQGRKRSQRNIGRA